MYKLYNGDCLEVMDRLIEEGIKVDCILTDIPYGTTSCKWDNIIPFEPMWERTNKLIKPNGVTCLFGTEPFSSALRMSNIKNYKYDWIWEKEQGAGFLNSKIMPLKATENISIFYNKKPLYNPQMIDVGKGWKSGSYNKFEGYNVYAEKENKKYCGTLRYPKNILKFNKETGLHPTQKPIKLLEYLIKTYTNENELVLDFTMGSGSTGVACMNTNRKFIGIELDNNYFDIASKRIEEAFFNAQNKEGAINEK